MKYILAILFFSFLSGVKADQLPKNVYGSFKFPSTAGRSVVGLLTISNGYLAYGSKLNGICSDSYSVKKLPNSRNYPNNLLNQSVVNANFQTYKLKFDNPEKCILGDDTIQISIKNNIEDQVSIKNKYSPIRSKDVNQIYLLTYKDKKLTGWYGKGFRVTKYID